MECSRYIHLNPNRAKITRPAERYRWSSYRNYVGGPPLASWVETGVTLREFNDDPGRYRAYVEAGKGERQVNPLERAVAGLVLGGEAFVRKVLARFEGEASGAATPSAGKRRRLGRATPESVEKEVARIFAGERPRRRRRMKLYGLRVHSRLTAGEVARRCGRSPAAVTLAVRDLEAEAKRNRALATQMRRLARAFVESSHQKTKI